MENKTPYPMLANRILRKAKRAEIAMQKQRKQSARKAPSGMLIMDGMGTLTPELTELPSWAAEREGYDMTFNAPMSISAAFVADLMNTYAPDESEALGLPTLDLNTHQFIWGETGSGMTNGLQTTESHLKD